MSSTPPQDFGDWAQLKEQTQPLQVVQAGLQNWMRGRLGDAELEIGPLNPPTFTGVANETLMFDVKRSNGTIEGYVARLSPPEPLYLDFELSFHYRMYAEMAAVQSVPTPGIVGYEPNPAVVGAEFFVMDKIEGVVPSDNPSWATQGFLIEASASERRELWENTVEAVARLHQVDPTPFEFLRTGATSDGVGDCLDYWMRALRWAAPPRPIPLVEEAQAWLLADRPTQTALSWGDCRPANIIYRDYRPVALLDWDLVSLAGPQADLAWWIITTPAEGLKLKGIGSHDDFVDLWEALIGESAGDLRWYLVFAAYRMAAIMAKLFAMFVAQGRMSAEQADEQLRTGLHVQLLAGLLDLPAPPGVTPEMPNVRCDR